MFIHKRGRNISSVYPGARAQAVDDDLPDPGRLKTEKFRVSADAYCGRWVSVEPIASMREEIVVIPQHRHHDIEHNGPDVYYGFLK